MAPAGPAIHRGGQDGYFPRHSGHVYHGNSFTSSEAAGNIGDILKRLNQSPDEQLPGQAPKPRLEIC